MEQNCSTLRAKVRVRFGGLRIRVSVRVKQV